MDYTAMGKRIRQCRQIKEYSQEALSEIVDISASYMGLIERGERIPSIATLAKLSEALDVNLDFIVLGKGSISNIHPRVFHFEKESNLDTTFSNKTNSNLRESLDKLFSIIEENADKWYK